MYWGFLGYESHAVSFPYAQVIIFQDPRPSVIYIRTYFIMIISELLNSFYITLAFIAVSFPT